jgi:hypothetical protein
MNRIIILVIVSVAVLISCSKEKTEKSPGDIQIQSLLCTLNPIEAWDTTLITVVATGSDLQYGWEANHGDIKGSGKTIKC